MQGRTDWAVHVALWQRGSGLTDAAVAQPALSTVYASDEAKASTPGATKRFLVSERTGFYLRVLKEGEVGVGDEFQLTMRNEPSVTVSEVTRLYTRDRGNVELLRRAVAVEALPEGWRTYFLDQLDKI